MGRTESEPATPGTTHEPSALVAASRGIVSFMAIVLIFRLLLGSLDLSRIARAIVAVGPGPVLLLIMAMVAGQAFKALIPVAILPQLGVARSFVAEQTSGVMSKLLPGPSGTAARFAIYRSFGFTSEDFGTCTIVNSLVSNGFVLAMPALTIAPFLIGGAVPGPIVVIAAIGVAISVVGSALVAAIARSEAFARWVGALGQRLTTWVQRLRKKPAPTDVGQQVAHFRDTAISALARSWRRLVPLMIGRYVINAALLFIALRAAGVDRSELGFYEILAVQVFAGILTMIEVTPGGLGVTEVVLIKLLTGAARTAAEDDVVVGVLLYRVVTYIGPMVLGAGSYLVWRRRTDWRSDGTAPPALATARFSN